MERLMSRLTRLSRELEEMGIEHDVLMTMKSLPAVLTEAEGKEIRLTYVPVETGGYLLYMTAALKAGEGGEENLVKWCDSFNERTLLAMACYEPLGNQVIFKCAVPEPEEITDGRTVAAVMEVFLSGVRQFEGKDHLYPKKEG